jgi:hypothetical protein
MIKASLNALDDKGLSFLFSVAGLSFNRQNAIAFNLHVLLTTEPELGKSDQNPLVGN